jgi:nucleotide-binding universal stress UspA family protein
MFDTIVLGLDGSEGCRPVVPVAVDLARRYEATLVIVHVDERVAGKGGIVPVRADEDEIKAEIRRQAEELAAQGIETKVQTREVVLGGPAHAIEHVAEREGAGLIVVGRRGHSVLPGLLVGSVPTRLLHVARRPVPAVPSEQS